MGGVDLKELTQDSAWSLEAYGEQGRRDQRQPVYGAAGMNLMHRALDVRHYGFPC